MEEDLFARLPSETTIDIFSRLSLRAIALSKCVCTPWLDLLESDDFVNSHLSKSAAALAISVSAISSTRDSRCCKVFELGDELGDLEIHDPITKFVFPRKARCEGSAGDFLFLCSSEVDSDALYVCNPITRESIELPFGDELVRSNPFGEVAYGFGASKVSRQHKVVRLTSESVYCHVYTLGTGRWRRVEAATATASSIYESAFANGNLYWLVSDASCETWICCFDLETERFSTVSSPHIREGLLNFGLFALRDCLCVVDDSTDDEIMLWLLEECGAEKSWKMAYVIDQHPDYDLFGFDCFQPVNMYESGDILILCGDRKTFCRYSIKTKTYQEIQSYSAVGNRFVQSLLFTPSFRSLKRSFGIENVISL